ncbi:cytochrome b [Luteibacter jiangsuensis]
MERNEPVPTRPRKLVALHWLTVLCVAVAATLILLRDELDGRALRAWLLEGHRHAGLLVLLLFAVRVWLRVRYGKLQPGGDHSRIVRFGAALTHVALYALLLALPLLGWAMCGAAGLDVHFFGLTLPAIVGENEDLADRLQAWHVDAAWALLMLVILHLSAALWHHFVVRDHTLRMMLPGRRR